MKLRVENNMLMINTCDTCNTRVFMLDLADVKTLIERLEKVRDHIEESESEENADSNK